MLSVCPREPIASAMDSDTPDESHVFADKFAVVSARIKDLILASDQLSITIANLNGAYDEIVASVGVTAGAGEVPDIMLSSKGVPLASTKEDTAKSVSNSLMCPGIGTSPKFSRGTTPERGAQSSRHGSKENNQKADGVDHRPPPLSDVPGVVVSPRCTDEYTSEGCNHLQEVPTMRASPLSLDGTPSLCLVAAPSTATHDQKSPRPPPGNPPQLRGSEMTTLCTGEPTLCTSDIEQPIWCTDQRYAAPNLHLRKEWCEGDTDLINGISQQLDVSVNRVESRCSMDSTVSGIELVDESSQVLRCPVVHPGGASRLVWNGLCLGLITYDILTIPMIAFGTFHSVGIIVTEWLCTLFWTADMIFNFRTGYFVGSQLEMRPNYIAYNYARTWLFLDILIVVLEWVGRFTAIAAPATLMRTSRILRTLRFLKLMRLAKMQRLWVTVSEQINSNTFHMVFNMSVLTFALMICVHLVSCAWYALGESEPDGWTSYDAYEGAKGLPFWYLASQRWVIAQLNGRTDMNDKRNMIERGFTCLVGITMSVIAKAVFTSVITKTLLELSQLTSENTRRRRLVNAYLETHHLSTTLTASVKRYLQEYQDPEKEQKKEIQVLAILPQHVQSDLLVEVRSPRLVKHSLFGTMSAEAPRTVRRICTTVVQMVAPVNYEIVFDKGDTCSRMLFIDRGTLTYGEPSERISDSFDRVDSSKFTWDKHVVLRPGQWVSEPALWSEWLNCARLVSDYYGCMYALHATVLAEVLKEDRGEYARAVLYARRYIKELTLPSQVLSDIVSFEVKAAMPHIGAPRYIRVTVVSATGLRNTDRIPGLPSGLFRAGKSDPYCVCEIGGNAIAGKKLRFTTSVAANCLEPHWDHSATLPYLDGSPLEFEVLDKDVGKKDDSLGKATLNAYQFLDKGFYGDLPLVGEKATGQLKVKVRLLGRNVAAPCERQ